MFIECDCSVDIGEPNRVDSCVVRRARVAHRCVECDRVIDPGEMYAVDSGIDVDGAAFRYKTCLGCYRIRQRFCSSGWYFGQVAEQVAECIGFDYREEPADGNET